MASEAEVTEALRAALAAGNKPLARAIADKWEAFKMQNAANAALSSGAPIGALPMEQINALDPAQTIFGGVQPALGPMEDHAKVLGLMAAPFAVAPAARLAGAAIRHPIATGAAAAGADQIAGTNYTQQVLQHLLGGR